MPISQSFRLAKKITIQLYFWLGKLFLKPKQLKNSCLYRGTALPSYFLAVYSYFFTYTANFLAWQGCLGKFT